MRKVDNPKQTLTIRVDIDVLEKIKEIANNEKKTPSYIANEALKVYAYEKALSPRRENLTTYTHTNEGDPLPLSKEQREYIRNLTIKDTITVNDKEITVLEFMRRCKRHISLIELKQLLKKSDFNELSRTLWR